jgi:FixJ family two-component response regulator
MAQSGAFDRLPSLPHFIAGPPVAHDVYGGEGTDGLPRGRARPTMTGGGLLTSGYDLGMSTTADVRHEGFKSTIPSMIFIVDDDADIREALTGQLNSADYEATSFASPEDFLDAPIPDVPSCVLVDVHMPGMNGFDLQAALAERGRDLPLIFMSAFGTIPMTVRAMKAGALEFLVKPIDEGELLSAIETALAHDARQSQTGLASADAKRRYATLTPREKEAFALAIGGLMNKQMAAELGTSEVTAKVHKRQVMAKMGARSLPDLVLIAEQLDIVAAKKR